jgi:flagellar biosynthesis regulator FlaF
MRSLPAESRQRSEDEILDQATTQLLKATKQEANKRGKSINSDVLRRQGHSERFIEKVRSVSAVLPGDSKSQLISLAPLRGGL